MGRIKPHKIMRKYKRLIMIILLFVPTLIVAQTSIKGKVIDARTGEPLTGVVVATKSSSNGGVSTDINGKFTLTISRNYPVTLDITYIGYQSQRIDVYDNEEPVIVRLIDRSKLLDEVVVTALNISKSRKALGYSAQEINGESLTQGKENNILNSLSGKVAGVRITNTQGDVGSSRIIIRGETSIAGENQPLFVLDGIPIDNSQLNSQAVGRDFKNSISDLNAEDIKSITVLKGPTAAALYGSRAAHGAVVITTKSGVKSKGFGVTFHSSTQFSIAATLPEYQNIFGQGAGGQFSYVDGKGAGINDGVDESWGPRLDIGLLIPQFDSPLDTNGNRIATPWISHPNNVKDYFRTGITTNNGISIQRADDNYQFRLGLNHEYQKSIVPGASNHKTNLSINTDYNLSKRVSVGFVGNYVSYNAPSVPGSGSPSGSNYRAYSTMLQFLWFGRQVNTTSLQEDYTRNWNSSYYANPYWSAYYNTQREERERVTGDIHATLHIIAGLDFRVRSSLDYYNDRRKAQVKWGTSGTPYGKYSEDAYTVKEKNTETILSYRKKINSDFNVDALLGWNVRNKYYENNYQEAPRLAVAELYTLTNSRDNLISSNYYYKLRQYSLYGSAQLSYRDLAFLTITCRNDWSSTLPEKNNSYFYPSISGSVILDRAFNFKIPIIDYWKLRGGWSKVGSDADPYQLATVYVSETAFKGNPLQISSGEGNNSDLKPEETISYEFGSEISLFNNRLRGDFTYYHTDSRNQILRLATTAASGYTTQVRNAGYIRNYGFEAQLGLTPIILRNTFRWDVDINFASNKSKVVKLDDEGLITSYQLYSSGIQILAAVGEPYGTLFGSAYTRDTNGQIVVDANGLPKVSSTSKVFGKYTPDWIGGINNKFTYRNISLSFLIDASIGGKIFSNTNKTGKYTGVLENTLSGRDSEHGGLWYYINNGQRIGIENPQYTTSSTGLYYASISGENTRVYQDGIIVQGVTENGEKNTTIVSAENYYHRLYSIAESNVYSASYVKLREVALSYAFPSKIIKHWYIQSLSLALVARNLCIIHKDAPNIDPESAITAGNAQGVEAYSLPTTRTFGFNINVSF